MPRHVPSPRTFLLCPQLRAEESLPPIAIRFWPLIMPPPASSQPKGILKKPKAPAVAAPPPDEPTPRPREQQIAIHQAQQLLRQRGEEVKPPVPLEVFERLSEFPIRRSGFSAANPSPDDAREFITALEDFMPREYLDLIEERNCVGNCGYTLCPKPRRSFKGEFKVLPTGVARTADLNMWCSDDCARRALFIKVQLDNPSYIRREGKMVVKIELSESEDELARGMSQLAISKDKDAAALAAERGDTKVLGRQIDVTIREKATVTAKAPDPNSEDAHLMLEGHRTTFGTKKEEDEDSDDDFLPSGIRMQLPSS